MANSSEQYLRKAERCTRAAAAELKASDGNRMTEAAHALANRTELLEEIEKQLYPAIVAVQTADGVLGTAFFRHSHWLVSNAHVLPDESSLKGAILVDKTAVIDVSYQRSFHRRVGSCPDLILVETNATHDFLKQTSKPNNAGVVCLYFFAYFDFHQNKHRFKFLKPEKLNGAPQEWKAEDDDAAPPGCSGAPIFRATVTVSQGKVFWHFQHVGVVYARRPTEKSRLFAVNADYDFSQLLKSHHIPLDNAARYTAMAEASGILRDFDQEKKLKAAALTSSETAADGLANYTAGFSEETFELPESQENLLGRGIISLSESALLPKVLKKLKNKDRRNQIKRRTGDVTDVGKLEEDVKTLLKKVEEMGTIVLGKGDLPSTTWFRLDVEGSSKKAWTIDLQDNFPSRAGKRIHVGTQPISSIFAIANVLEGYSDIEGSSLAKALEKSKEQGKAITCESPKMTDKKRKRRGEFGS